MLPKNYKIHSQKIPSYPLTFFDTPGIYDDKIQTNIDLIKKKNIELGESKSKILAIFYVVNSQDQRYFCDYENKIFKFILEEIKIPLYVLLTRVTSNMVGDDLPVIIRNFHQFTKGIKMDYKYNGENIEKYIFFVNVIGHTKMGIDKLFSQVYADFRQYIITEEINKSNIKRVTKRL